MLTKSLMQKMSIGLLLFIFSSSFLTAQDKPAVKDTLKEKAHKMEKQSKHHDMMEMGKSEERGAEMHGESKHHDMMKMKEGEEKGHDMDKMKSEQKAGCCASGKDTAKEESEVSMKKEIWNAVCPVKGMEVDPDSPTVEYNGKLIGFCCPGCDKKFSADPEKYIKNLSEDGKEFIGSK